MVDRTLDGMGAAAWFTGIREAVLEAVDGDRISLDDLTDRLVEDGWLDGLGARDRLDHIDLVAEVVADSQVVVLSSELEVVTVQALVDGRRFTHRLTQDELATERVPVSPDLDLVTLDLGEGPVPGRDGDTWTLLAQEDTIDIGGPPAWDLIGPSGWLADFEVGDLVVIGRERGALYVDQQDADVGTQAGVTAEALDEAFLATAEPDEGSFAVPLVVEAVAQDDDLFREPQLPVSELLVRAGYEQDGQLFGPEGGDWERSAERAIRIATDRQIEHLHLEDCCRMCLGLVLLGWSGFRGEADIDLSPEAVGVQLDHGDVAEAFVIVAWAMADPPPPLEGFLESMGASAGAELALALHAERLGDALEAEARVKEALQLDDGYEAAARLRGWYALDRGDLTSARRYLYEGGAPDEVIDGLDSFLAAPAGIGRNSPCPCGSGRKYKACCLGSPALSPAMRVVLAHSRMATFALTGFLHDRAAAVFTVALAASVDPGRLADTGFLSQVALYEGGAAAEYLERRGALLPADEHELVEQLVVAPLQLWDVAQVGNGSMTLLGASGEQRQRVVSGVPAERRRAGELLLGRVVRHGGEDHLVGTSPIIDLRQREAVLDLVNSEPTAEDWAEWYGAARADALASER